jgi:hypothetical protein
MDNVNFHFMKKVSDHKVMLHRVRQAVQRALHSGKLVKRACERCGSRQSESHHEDYSKPLDVMWLCDICYLQRHYEMDGEIDCKWCGDKRPCGKNHSHERRQERYRRMGLMNYLLSGIDVEAWKKVKIKAINEGVTVKDVILALLMLWVEGRVKIKAS